MTQRASPMCIPARIQCQTRFRTEGETACLPFCFIDSAGIQPGPRQPGRLLAFQTPATIESRSVRASITGLKCTSYSPYGGLGNLFPKTADRWRFRLESIRKEIAFLSQRLWRNRLSENCVRSNQPLSASAVQRYWRAALLSPIQFRHSVARQGR